MCVCVCVGVSIHVVHVHNIVCMHHNYVMRNADIIVFHLFKIIMLMKSLIELVIIHISMFFFCLVKLHKKWAPCDSQ